MSIPTVGPFTVGDRAKIRPTSYDLITRSIMGCARKMLPYVIVSEVSEPHVRLIGKESWVHYTHLEQVSPLEKLAEQA